MKIVFKTNGGKNIGLGHVYRCISLAEALKIVCPKVKVVFFSNFETKDLIIEKGFSYECSEKFNKEDLSKIRSYKPDIVIIDSYLANNSYLRNIKFFSKLVLFDDNNDIYDSKIPDKIINGNLHSWNLNYANKRNHLLGPRYLVMKKEYWSLSEDFNYNLEESVLLTTGGADSHRIMLQFVRSLKYLPIKKRVIIGPAYDMNYVKEIKKEIRDDTTFDVIYKPKSLKKYLETSLVVLTASGSTVYEVLTLKKIPIIYILARNQEMLSKELEKYGITNLGYYNGIDWQILHTLLIDKIYNYDSELKKLNSLFSLFDGKGAIRVAYHILKGINERDS